MRAWLTEIVLPRKQARLTLDAGAVHRWMTRAADGPGFLWASPRVGTIIVQTAQPLDRDALGGTRHVFAAQHSLDYAPGARVEVSGIVSPTKAEFSRGARGSVVPLAPHEQTGWVLRKLSPALSGIEHLRVEPMRASRGTSSSGHRVTHSRASIALHGTVRDAALLREMLASGVGRGKRFGTGLLLAKELT